MMKQGTTQQLVKRLSLLQVIVLALFIPATSFASSPKLFGSSESHSSGLSAFPKWTSVLNKEDRDLKKLENECKTEKCAWQKWSSLLNSAKSLSKREQLEQVNRAFNKVKYVEDPDNWGQKDVWVTTYEFLGRNKGDCEDYAITKYFALKALGFSADDMRIVVLNDNNLRLLHSVLAVYMDDKIYILDNQSSQVMSDRSIRHYKPIYSVNESGWWRHSAR